jgi:phage shock protein A
MASGFAIIDKLTRFLGTAIDDTVRLADDPEKLLSGLIAEMTGDLVQAKNHLAELKKEDRRLSQEIELREDAARQWGQRAKAAVRAGDDVVAKDALVRKRQNDDQADRLRGELQRQRQNAEYLMNALIGLNLRIEEAKHKRNEIVLRAKRAHAGTTIAEVVRQSARAAPADILDRVGRQIDRVESEAGLLPELSEEAIASSVSAVDKPLGPEADLRRLKRAVTESDRTPPKPLAKTRARQDDSGKSLTRSAKGSTRDRAKVAGQKRTKR